MSIQTQEVNKKVAKRLAEEVFSNWNMEAYEARIFDASGHLTPNAMPRYIPPVQGERVGKAA
jgi:hypothetical protein